jgi:hypothetical protein
MSSLRHALVWLALAAVRTHAASAGNCAAQVALLLGAAPPTHPRLRRLLTPPTAAPP